VTLALERRVLKWIRQRPFQAEYDETDGANVITGDLESESEFSLQTVANIITTLTPTSWKQTIPNDLKVQSDSSEYDKEATNLDKAVVDLFPTIQKAQLEQIQPIHWVNAEEEKMVYHVWDFGGRYYHTHHIRRRPLFAGYRCVSR